jgi:hypothetical protein
MTSTWVRTHLLVVTLCVFNGGAGALGATTGDWGTCKQGRPVHRKDMEFTFIFTSSLEFYSIQSLAQVTWVRQRLTRHAGRKRRHEGDGAYQMCQKDAHSLCRITIYVVTILSSYHVCLRCAPFRGVWGIMHCKSQLSAVLIEPTRVQHMPFAVVRL